MYGEQEKEKKPAQSDQAKKRDEFEKLQKAKRIAALQYRMAKDAETVAKMSQTERKLTDAEKDKLKKYEKDIDMKDFIDRYGEEEGKSIYYATLTKMAKGESLWANIHKKRQRIKQGSGERMRKKGEKGAPTAAQMKRAKGESIDEINVPAIIKSVISRMTHPKGYAMMLQKYVEMVKDGKGKHNNRFYASRVAQLFGLNSVFPLVDYINKLVNSGKLPQALMAQYDQNESYEIGKDYYEHTKEIDPYSAPQNEKSTLKKDKKLPNLMIPKKGKAGATKFQKRKSLSRLAALYDLGEIDEQTEHEITVGNYTTKHFYMCGSAQEVMKANKDKIGAEELTRLQDEFYKLEADMMNSGEPATGLQKQQARRKYNEIMNQAAEMELADDITNYMKQHLDSIEKGDPKPGFGRTDLKEDFQLDEKIAGLVNKSEKTGVPYGILKKSYDRGMAAWKGGHRPGATQQQWAFARVNSMLTGGKADPDLQAKIKAGGYKKKKKKASKESVEEWFSSNETIKLYQERYGDEWLKKLNNTYERMLSKLNEDDCSCYDHVISEAEYQGRKVKLNDPFRLPTGSKKKFGVYVKNEKGNIVKVTFGDPNMGINRDDPEARKNFRARHSCDDNPGPKWKARYWSCYQWRAGAKVDN